MVEKFDAIVVGAGPSGNAAAYTLAKGGLNVLQLERGEYPGAKNVQGGIMYAAELEKIIPDFRDDCPTERHIIEQRVWLLGDDSYIGTNYRSDAFNTDRPNRYTIIRANIDKWFSEKIREAGGLQICETTVTELIRDGSGKVIGVRTDREGGEIHADVVIMADGVNALLAKRAGYQPELQPQNVALAVKEILFIDPELIQQRFGVKEEEGVVIEIMGKVTKGMAGTAFLYTNKESLTIGIGCLISDFKAGQCPPYKMLEDLKAHPVIKPLIDGAEMKEYAAHMIPEGGYKAIPQLYGPGWMVAGDAAHFNNAAHREGSNLAMASGRMAAETVLELKAKGQPCTAANLAAYKAKLDQSFIMKDLKKYRNLPSVLHGNKQFFSEYPDVINAAAHNWFTVDSVDKKTKEKQIMGSFVKTRSVLGLVGDAIKLVRSVR
ncbi:NAD(P)-binding protein [Azospirillum sp. RWY-5-1]|uniref:Protein FixC n=1 Tax=Azospirillum oleiclasticum TaxID=2735135 RepID=A0ABX2TKL8_9PROT|nr:FAD-dependent monooxygenase [Azospirillum oleiclasticum]NYZ15892.1 NAD(P)-binding protein [Azospirillum oleiclasticum]NYZ23629.1 NAD(P)-binding protein [Azospirillum oleiclasticum]